MHPNAALVERFYASFHARDAEAMAACYHRDAVYRDPVFGELRGRRVGDMWRLLVGRARDLAVTATRIQADDEAGTAKWTATYTIGKKRRLVRNVIRARFEFRDGLIVLHEDAFSLWKWAGMAMGAGGWLLGWAPPLRERIRREARRGLEAFATGR